MNEPQPLKRPIAHYMYPGDVTVFAERGERCEHIGCREAVVIHTLRWYRREGRVLVAEHFYCEAHGRAFARRYRVEVESEPDVSGMS